MSRRIAAIVAGASLVACLFGAAQVTSGLAVPLQAHAAQHRLAASFEQRLARSRAAAKVEAPETTALGAPATARRHPQATIRAPLPSDGAVARITVERLGVSEIVLAGDGTHEQLAQGPTLIRRTGGANPVTVLAAHRDTHFLFMRDLREGDTVTMELVDGTRERYRVTRLDTVRKDAFSYPLDPARPLLALTTCFPFGGADYGGPLRRVAWAERI